jgi:ribosomal protein RSM22 (predicted rRNA methylase)
MSEEMRKKIESFLEGVSLKSLLSSSKKISEEYRLLGKRQGAQQKEEDVLAYLAIRMPATYAALYRVFEELQKRFAGFAPVSLLDVGSGPGTTLWAAADCFPTLEKIQCVEQDAQFLSIAKRLGEDVRLYPRAQWTQADMRKEFSHEAPYDVVVASYSLGELSEEERLSVVKRLWALTDRVLVLVEPGTPKGFASMRAIRKQLLDAGGFLIAPCPHSETCSMAQSDWCHFYARLGRSSLHRKAKEAELNYEDEKFSYLIFSRTPAASAASRILRHPRKSKGHVQLTLCTTEGIRDAAITKKEPELYRLAKKSDWGDSFCR